MTKFQGGLWRTSVGSRFSDWFILLSSDTLGSGGFLYGVCYAAPGSWAGRAAFHVTKSAVTGQPGRTVPSGSSDLVGVAPPVCSDPLERSCTVVLDTFTDDLVLIHYSGWLVKSTHATLVLVVCVLKGFATKMVSLLT